MLRLIFKAVSFYGYFPSIVLVIIIASVMPTVIHIARKKEDRKEIIEGLKKIRAKLFQKTTGS